MQTVWSAFFMPYSWRGRSTTLENHCKLIQYIPPFHLHHAAEPTLARRKDLLLRCGCSAMALEYNLGTSDHLEALALATL